MARARWQAAIRITTAHQAAANARAQVRLATLLRLSQKHHAYMLNIAFVCMQAQARKCIRRRSSGTFTRLRIHYMLIALCVHECRCSRKLWAAQPCAP